MQERPEEAAVVAGEDEAARLLVSRIRIGLWLIVGAGAILATGDLLFEESSDPFLRVLLVAQFAIVALQVGVVALLAGMLRRSSRTSAARSIALLAIVVIAVTTAVAGILVRDDRTTAIVYVLLVLISATMIPWGMRAQLVTVGAAAAALLWNIWAVSGSLTAFGLPALATVLFAFGASVFMARHLDRYRRAVEREQAQRRRAEEALRLVESAVEQANDAMVIISPETEGEGSTIIYVNPAFCRMTGYHAEEVMGRPLWMLFGPRPDWDAMARMRDALRTEQASIGETQLVRKDGTPYVLEWHTAPVRDPEGRISNWVSINRDVTERKRVEAEKSALLEMTRDVGGTLDLDEILDRVQKRTVDLLRCERVALFSWEVPRGVLRLKAGYRLPAHGDARPADIEIDGSDPFVERLVREGTIAVAGPGEHSVLPEPLLRRLRPHAMLATQLVARGRMLGVLVASGTRAFERNQIQLLEGIAQQVAVAIHTAELFQLQHQEAEVSRALARVGEEIISSLDTPVLLGRLCELITQMLGTDSTQTFLFKPEEEAYVAVSDYGDPSEQWESIRLLRIPRDGLGDLLRRLDEQEVVELAPASESARDPIARLRDQFGLRVSLLVGLRRGGEMIGFFASHYRNRDGEFSARHPRILRGIAHLGSMALENARLVEELEHANRLKSDFVATMSHELRTPLNVILGYNDLMLDGVFGDLNEEQKDALTRADKSARELLDLITATLDLSRLEARRIDLQVQDVDVARLVAEVVEEPSRLREKPDIMFEVSVNGELPTVRTDPVKLKMVLKNLIHNAIKFTEVGGVTVAAAEIGGGVRFNITDTGIGISPEARSLIFEPFRQLDSSDTRRYGGAGLGLYIVDRLLDVLGGSIAVDSEEGRGSTFSVWIPPEIPAEEGVPPPRRIGDAGEAAA